MSMKKIFLCFSVFFSVFCMGLCCVFLLRIVSGPAAVKTPPVPSLAETAEKLAKTTDRAAPRHLRPLTLPLGMSADRCPEKSWEFSGDADGNMVSVRGRLVAAFSSQGWLPDKKITLDESLSPRELLTFTQHNYELILMLWKISGSMTGFAYRRDLQDKPIGKVTQ